MPTVSLAPYVVTQFLDDVGNPVSGGTLETYLAGTSTPAATYADGAGAVANPTTIQLDTTGRPSNGGALVDIRLDIAKAYKFVLKSSTGAVVRTVDNVSVGVPPASVGPDALAPGAVTEQAITNDTAELEAITGKLLYQYPYSGGPVRTLAQRLDEAIIYRGDGTDKTAVLQQAVAAAAGRRLIVGGVTIISSQITLPSDVEIVFEAGARIETATPDISLFYATGKSGIRVLGGHFKQTAAGSTAYFGAVHLDQCSHCTVQNCEFEGMQWAGVYLNRSTYCTVSHNYFHDFLGTIQDSADICIHRDSRYNLVQGNICFGGNDHGVLVQDPYTGQVPLRNVVDANVIGEHDAYGICAYTTVVGDSFTTITGNYIENIRGTSVSGASGSGIYVVGYASGGTLIANNNVRNCNTQTSSRTNAPGAIAVSGLSLNGQPVTITGNVVSEVTRYDGILCVTNEGTPIVVSGNSIRMPAGNTTGDPIRIERSDNTSVTSNNIVRASDQGRCIYIRINAANMKNVVVSGNTCVGGAYRSIEVEQITSGRLSGLTIANNIANGQGAGGVPVYIQHADNVAITGNVFEGTNSYAMFIENCTAARVSTNVLVTAGTKAFGTSGSCAGGMFDKSNRLSGVIENTGTGFYCEQMLSAAPSSSQSFAQLGDRVQNTAPTVGNPKGWRCTAAGNPGTWTSEGAL